MPQARKLKPIRIAGDHAIAESLRPEEKIKYARYVKRNYPMIRRVSRKENQPAYSIASSIARLLYPRNFPLVIASGTDRKTTIMKRTILSNESQAGIEDYYKMREEGSGPNGLLYWPYRDKISERAIKLYKKIYKESGISVNTSSPNVGVGRKGNMVFFEISGIVIKPLERKIRTMPEASERQKLLKAQAIELLKRIKEIADGDESISVHTQ